MGWKSIRYSKIFTKTSRKNQQYQTVVTCEVSTSFRTSYNYHRFLIK